MNGRRQKVSKIHLKFNQNEIHETTHIALSRTQHSNLSLLIMWNFGESQLETLAMKSHVVLNIFQTQGLLKWKETTREKKFWAQHIQFRIHIHTQMFCAMSHKAWRWWWWRRRRVVGAGRSFSLLLSLLERAEGETIFWTFSCIQHLSFVGIFLACCYRYVWARVKKEGNLFEIDDDDFNLITLKIFVCTLPNEWVWAEMPWKIVKHDWNWSVAEKRILEKFSHSSPAREI